MGDLSRAYTYYNENDPFAAAWLRELVKANLIADGEVDERSIADVEPVDVKGFTQCHFFAGIGGWSLALRLTRWPDDRPVWTGSCPCQPFSSAGKRRGSGDERHLWPEFQRLIQECRPAILFGEQVASKDGREWLAGVRADLEALGYAIGAADLCAASAGAPHIRQRLFWLAYAHKVSSGQGSSVVERSNHRSDALQGTGLSSGCSIGGLAYIDGRHESDRDVQRSGEHGQQPEDSRFDGLGYDDEPRPEGRSLPGSECSYQWPAGTTNRLFGYLDGKARRIEPGAFPLAHGVPARMGRLRGYGNAIVPQVAAAFIEESLEALAAARRPVFDLGSLL